MKRWARQLGRRHGDVPPLALVAAVADRAAEALGRPPVAPPALDRPDLTGHPVPPGGWADPWLLGLVHEQAAPAADRRARGAWYTPRPVVEGLVSLALTTARHGGGALGPDRVVDPTCGGGAFLLAALDQLVAAGCSPDEAVSRVAGMDLDGDAVEVTRWAVALWWQLHGAPGPAPAPEVTVGDALDPPVGRPERTLVVGNPPFASPLRRGVIPEPAARFRTDRAEVLGPYADLAAIHLLRSVEGVGPGSTVALVLPQSVLAGRDTENLRSHLGRVAPLRALWAVREPVFDAAVRACAVVLAVGDGPADGNRVGTAPGPGSGPDPVAGEVVLAHGPAVVRRARAAGPDRDCARSWAELGADALGAPPLPPMSGRCLGELVTATAGFRDEYYALVAACREAEPGEEPDGRATARVATVGSIDPLWTAWGRGPLRFGGQDRVRPVVDRAAMQGRVLGWLDRQLRPKVLLATQTRLLEPLVDRAGVIAPATPLIAVHADPAWLDRVAAVLLAPPVVVWAWRRWFGTAMAIDAVKLAARQVGELPLPADEALWGRAAALVATADGADRAGAHRVTVEVARLMTAAYGASDEVFDWWLARLGPAPPPPDGGREMVGVGIGPVR